MNKLIILIQGQQDEREEVERSYFRADQQRGGHDCGPPYDQSREGRPHRLLQTVQIPGPDHLSQKGLLQAENSVSKSGIWYMYCLIYWIVMTAKYMNMRMRFRMHIWDIPVWHVYLFANFHLNQHIKWSLYLIIILNSLFSMQTLRTIRSSESLDTCNRNPPPPSTPLKSMPR